MIADEKEFKGTLREVSIAPDAPVQYKAGQWKITDRIAVWETVAAKMFDEQLDRFASVAIKVLGERNPGLDLEKSDRYMASIYGKTLTHSSTLRRGIAETLALIGTRSALLTAVAPSKPGEITYRVLNSLLSDKSWDTWASLDDALPIIAEANPETYLSIVEAALTSQENPFAELFRQEVSGFTSRTYMSGFLWSLEGLAWDPELFGRIILILGELAAMDPGGTYANRPSNSLVTILLPWFPQTLAPVERRIAAVKALTVDLPDVAWKLILKLLPNSQQSSSMSHKPAFRSLIPTDWKEGSTNADYWKQISAYSEMAVDQAIVNAARIPALVDHLGNLTASSLNRFLDHLSSSTVRDLDDRDRIPIWNELFDFIVQNRKYAEAKWAAPPEILKRIETIAGALEPTDATDRYRRLFGRREFDLYEQKDDYTLARTVLSEKRASAAKEIYEESGLDGLLAFAKSVESPGHVGEALAVNEIPSVDLQILPELIEDDDRSTVSFLYGYVRTRYRAGRGAWLVELGIGNWNPVQKALFLALLPFTPDIYKAADVLPVDAAKLYWERVSANAYESEEDPSYAIGKLVDVGRRVDAADLLQSALYKQLKPNPTQVVTILLSLEAEDVSRVGGHTIAQLIKSVQEDSGVSEPDLLKIEWAYLGILDGTFGATPIHLQRALAREPEFFCEVIRAVFRSKNQESEAPGTDERSESIATNGYRLLREWREPPGGTSDNGDFSKELLEQWLSHVKKSCKESGHLDIAMQQVGAVLFYAPADPSGLWLHAAAADVLNAKDGEHLRTGFRTEIFNSRGVHFVDPEAKPERDLASNYRQKAADLELAGYIRLATTLREVAADYDREAERILRTVYDG